MSTTTLVVLVIVGALMLVCGVTFAVMLHNLELFDVRLTAWYDLVIPLLVAAVGLVLVIQGLRALRRAKRDSAAA